MPTSPTLSPDPPASAISHAPALVRGVQRIEGSRSLDLGVRAIRPLADAVLADPARRAALRGMWLGHALHPLMTDLPIGFWTSANVLDLVGGPGSRAASRRLVALGLVSAVPTAVTGVAEWGSSAGPREQRVGVVHAAANVTALGLYAASYGARRRSRHARGVLLALAGSAAATAGGFLGGHLTSARKVSSVHPHLEEENR
jgi:hypothetical protein